jgi:hypothetical protein
MILMSQVKELVCFEPHEQFFSHLAAVTIAGDGCKFRPMLSTYSF